MLESQGNSCPICGSSRLRNFRAEAADVAASTPVHIIECKTCVFAWQYPLTRTAQESVQFFEAAYLGSGECNSSYFDPAYKRQIAELEYGFVSTLSASPGSLLDIGAGGGMFAEVATEGGWSVTALDPALDIHRLRGNPKVTAIKGSMEQISSDSRFDVVTLWDVIEHTEDPMGTITKAKEYLKKDGWLILETGNYKSIGRISGGLSHWIYQLDHRWYFSPDSMKRLLRTAGFSEFVVSDKVLRPGWSGCATYKGPSRLKVVQSIIRDPIHLGTHLSTYAALNLARNWEMPGIEIFALAARARK